MTQQMHFVPNILIFIVKGKRILFDTVCRHQSLSFILNRVFPEANVWIGGDARMSFSVLDLKGRTDMFFKMPSPLKVKFFLFHV